MSNSSEQGVNLKPLPFQNLGESIVIFMEHADDNILRHVLNFVKISLSKFFCL